MLVHDSATKRRRETLNFLQPTGVPFGRSETKSDKADDGKHTEWREDNTAALGLKRTDDEWLILQ
jgi:hypothetical protein